MPNLPAKFCERWGCTAILFLRETEKGQVQRLQSSPAGFSAAAFAQNLVATRLEAPLLHSFIHSLLHSFIHSFIHTTNLSLRAFTWQELSAARDKCMWFTAQRKGWHVLSTSFCHLQIPTKRVPLGTTADRCLVRRPSIDSCLCQDSGAQEKLQKHPPFKDCPGQTFTC